MSLKSFGDLLSESFEAYKQHFALFMKVAFILYFVPVMIFGGATIYYATAYPQAIGRVLSLYLVELFVVTVLSLLLTFTVIKILLLKKTKKELSVSEAINEGSKHFVEGLVLSVSMGFMLFFLYMLFIIPGIIFATYWAFALYALITDNVHVKEALNHSKRVVEGRWWTVFGYLLLFSIVMAAISFAIEFPVSFFLTIYGTFTISENLATLVDFVFTIGIQMVLQPWMLVFMEKFYLDLKKNRKKTSH